MAFTSSAPTGFKPKNKLRRQAAHLSIKKAREAEKRDLRHRRKRDEAKNPSLRQERLAQNIPATIDSKRVWDDELVGDEEDALGWSVDVGRLVKKRKLEEEAAEQEDGGDDEEEGVLAKLRKRDEEADESEEENDNMDVDSMLDSDSDSESSDSDDDSESAPPRTSRKQPAKREASPTASTATNLELSPEFLKQKFPQLFEPVEEPKILITTSINSTLYEEARALESIFPNSRFVRRTAHAHAHKYSVREIAQFASARDYTALVVLMQAHHEKQPDGLDIIHLPNGPHFHFSISNYLDGKKLPKYAVDTGHYPELILNNFKTPLGILTAHLFRNLFPAQPELEGRQVLTLHNQRDYIFFRRHRYIFRDKRETEKPITGADGKPMKGAEEIKVGMQEIGPRMTLKLRRVDRGIQFKSGQEWQWKGRMEKKRTRFNM